jgi:hypothetical protein
LHEFTIAHEWIGSRVDEYGKRKTNESGIVNQDIPSLRYLFPGLRN